MPAAYKTALQKLRREAGYKSAAAYADHMGYPRTSYTKYEQGRAALPLERAWAIVTLAPRITDTCATASTICAPTCRPSTPRITWGLARNVLQYQMVRMLHPHIWINENRPFRAVFRCGASFSQKVMNSSRSRNGLKWRKMAQFGAKNIYSRLGKFFHFPIAFLFLFGYKLTNG